MDESLSDRIRKRVEQAQREHPEEYMTLLPRKEPPEPDPDTDKELFSPARSSYEATLDSINDKTQTASEFHETKELDHTLNSLNQLLSSLNQPQRHRGLGAWIRRMINKFIWVGIHPELSCIQKALSETTRTLNALNHKTRVYAGQQESLNSEIAIFGQAIVPVIDEKIRYSLEKHATYLKDRMDIVHEGMDRRQTEIANWLHNTTKAFEDCVAKVQDLESELKRGLALQHRKLEQSLSHHDSIQQVPLSDTHRTGSGEEAGGSYAYYLFETQGRGSETLIMERQMEYVPLFEESNPVLDLGCGRGEFLDLLRKNAIPARGIDSNPDMVEVCKNKGLDVVCGDAVEYLASHEPDCLGGVFAAQVIEHLPAVRIHQLLSNAFRVLKPGGVLLLETVNTRSPYALMNYFFRDPTHHLPIHPETYKFFAEISGFEQVKISYRSPVPENERPTLPLHPGEETEITESLRKLSEAMQHVIDFVYAPCDIVVCGRKPKAFT